jgi:hypothetical protein
MAGLCYDTPPVEATPFTVDISEKTACKRARLTASVGLQWEAEGE